MTLKFLQSRFVTDVAWKFQSSWKTSNELNKNDFKKGTNNQWLCGTIRLYIHAFQII